MKIPRLNLNPDPALQPGEEVIWKRPVERSRDGRTGIGGTLYLTDRAVIFNANLLNPPKLRVQEIYPRSRIACVDLADRAWKAYDGGVRRRLRVMLDDGSSILFVVPKGLEEAVDYLSKAISDDE